MVQRQYPSGFSTHSTELIKAHAPGYPSSGLQQEQSIRGDLERWNSGGRTADERCRAWPHHHFGDCQTNAQT